MSIFGPDTRPEAEAVQLELLRRAPAWRNLALLGEVNEAVRSLALSGLRTRYPADTPEQRRRLADLLLGPQSAAKACGPPPDSDRRAA